MPLRQLIFWPHLIAGVTAGAIILVMSVTGVLLTYERQLLNWADSGFQSAPPSAGARPLPMDAVLDRVRAQRPGLELTTVGRRAGETAPVTFGSGAQTVYVDAYTGAVIGEASPTGIRRTMSTLREVHRWLALSGARRELGKAITGWANVLFLFIVLSGMYLWLPRRWTRQHVRTVAVFNARLSGKARDFNWHNVVGLWSAVPLLIIVLGAIPISFGWGNALVYRLAGDAPPAPAGPRGAVPDRRGEESGAGREESGRTPAVPVLDGLAAAWAAAEAYTAGWTSISLRVPATADAPYVFTIDRGTGGQPQYRDTVTIDRAGAIDKVEMFADAPRGRQLRSILRFAHTGEVLGIPGQTIAGVATAGACMLVYTGLALSWRRFFRRARAGRPVSPPVAPAE